MKEGRRAAPAGVETLVLVPRRLAPFRLVPFVAAQLAMQEDDVPGGKEEPDQWMPALLAVTVADDGLV